MIRVAYFLRKQRKRARSSEKETLTPFGCWFSRAQNKWLHKQWPHTHTHTSTHQNYTTCIHWYRIMKKPNAAEILCRWCSRSPIIQRERAPRTEEWNIPSLFSFLFISLARHFFFHFSLFLRSAMSISFFLSLSLSLFPSHSLLAVRVRVCESNKTNIEQNYHPFIFARRCVRESANKRRTAWIRMRFFFFLFFCCFVIGIYFVV